MMFQNTLLLLLVAHVSSYTSSYTSPVREWATETQGYQPNYAGHYGGKYEPGPWTGSFSRTLDTADGFQQGKSSRWTGSSPTGSYSPYVQPMWNGAGNNNGYYPTNEYSYDRMYASPQGQGYQKSNNNGYRFYDDNNYNRDTRYATPYGAQSYRSPNQQGNYGYGVSSPQYASGNYRSARDGAYSNQAYGGSASGYRNAGGSYGYDSRRSEQMNGKKVDRWTGSSPATSNSRYLYDYGGRYYNIDGAYGDAYFNNGAQMPYRQEQGAYNNAYGHRGEDYRYGEHNYQTQGYRASSMDGRGPYNQWTTPSSNSNNYGNRSYDRSQGYSDRSQAYSRNGGYDSREAYYDGGYGRYGFDRNAYRANGQMNSFQNSIYSHSQSGRQGQSWKSPLSPDDLASRKSSDDWSSASI